MKNTSRYEQLKDMLEYDDLNISAFSENEEYEFFIGILVVVGRLHPGAFFHGGPGTVDDVIDEPPFSLAALRQHQEKQRAAALIKENIFIPAAVAVAVKIHVHAGQGGRPAIALLLQGFQHSLRQAKAFKCCFHVSFFLLYTYFVMIILASNIPICNSDLLECIPFQKIKKSEILELWTKFEKYGIL